MSCVTHVVRDSRSHGYLGVCDSLQNQMYSTADSTQLHPNDGS